MNCMIHHERAAVNTCKLCNGGLCPDCMAKKLTIGENMVCESCFIENGNNYVAQLEQELVKSKKIKRNLTIIFIIGLALGVFGLIENISRLGINRIDFGGILFVMGFIWGFHIFFDGTFLNRILRQKSVQEQMRDGIMEANMMKDNSIFIYWGIKIVMTFVIFWFRGLLFPIFYGMLMFGKDSKRMQDNINDARERIDLVMKHGDLHKQDEQR